MSKEIRRDPSHQRDLCRCFRATPPSRLRDAGSSYNLSLSSISLSSAGDPSREITDEVEVATEASRARPRHSADRFLKGPIPLPSLAIAARLPGKALAVYLVIVHRRDLTHEP